MPPQRITLSPDIVARLQVRDPSAYDELLREAFPILVRFAYRYTNAVEVAEDVVQDVFVKIYLQAEQFTPGTSVVAYLLAAVRNSALSWLRRKDVEQKYQPVVQEVAELRPLPNGEQLVEDSDTHMIIERALDSMTERQRTAFDLRYRRELTIPEIAQVLGISSKAAEKLVSRTAHALRELLKNQIR